MSRPEVRIAIFGFLTAFLWEMWQMPFYDRTGLSIADAVRGCSLGSFGDAGILVLAYFVAGKVAHDRYWLCNWSAAPLAAYLATGLAITIVVEHIALNSEWGWRYSDAMPRDPAFGTGLVPVLMWIIVPVVVLWLARNQNADR